MNRDHDKDALNEEQLNEVQGGTGVKAPSGDGKQLLDYDWIAKVNRQPESKPLGVPDVLATKK